jgi:hypothetical protein
VRVQRYQAATVRQAMQMIGSLGADGPAQLNPHLLRKRLTPSLVQSYAEIYEWLKPGQLLSERPASWESDWAVTSPDRFTP